MSNVQIKAKKEDVVERILKEILKLKTPGGVAGGFGFEARLTILSHCIGLKGVHDTDQTRSIIRRAILGRWINYIKPNSITFSKAVSKELENFLAHSLENYRILFLLNAAPQSFAKRKSFSSLGYHFAIRSHRYIENEFEVNRLLDSSYFVIPNNLQKRLLEDFTPITVQGAWKTQSEAINSTIRAFDLYRVLLNLPKQFGRFVMQFGATHPLGWLLPSPIYGIFDDSGKYINLYFTEEIHDYTIRSLEPEQIIQADKLIRSLSKASNDNSTTRLLIEILSKYSEALDTSNWRQAFLSLWQCLELVTLQTKNNINMKTIVSRVGTLVGGHKLTTEILECMLEARNKLVHEGHFSEGGLSQVNLLKFVVECVIEFLGTNLEVFTTKTHLEEFYCHAPLNDSNLAVRQQVISRIRAKRKANK